LDSWNLGKTAGKLNGPPMATRKILQGPEIMELAGKINSDPSRALYL
jgi:hypothetical protein